MKHPKGCGDVIPQEWKESADRVAFLTAPTVSRYAGDPDELKLPSQLGDRCFSCSNNGCIKRPQ
jgi:hypothetical protein